MLSTKNYNNNSSLFANTGKFNSIEADNIYNKTETDLLITSIDLTNYYIKSEVDGKINGVYSILNNEYYDQISMDEYFYKKTEIISRFNNIYDKTYINSTLLNYYTQTQSDARYYTQT
jgi:hypothetical protein